MKRMLATGILTLGFISPGVHAHGGDDTKKPKSTASSGSETDFGRPGDPKRVTRTVRMDMHDSMRYSVDRIKVRQGETIRFVMRNTGKVMHEMVLGTPREIAEHAELMRKFPGMEHDEEYQLHVKPGTTGEMIWQFTKAGEFAFACLVPGHYEAGMAGNVVVLERARESGRKVVRREVAGGGG
jgi:uncharacterized cupredoxin-like copper-binding protein